MATCKACGAAIVWAKAKSGKAMPVDAEPHPEGNIRLSSDGGCEVLGKDDLESVRAMEDLGGPYTRLHRSHFATCSSAARFRRPRA